MKHAFAFIAVLLLAPLVQAAEKPADKPNIIFILADDYGIPGVEGSEMRKVDLGPESHRGGLLRHASFQIVTSNPTRTSPVSSSARSRSVVLPAPGALIKLITVTPRASSRQPIEASVSATSAAIPRM